MSWEPSGSWGGNSPANSWDAPQWRVDYSQGATGYTPAWKGMGYETPQNYIDMLIGNRRGLMSHEDTFKQKDRELQAAMQREQLNAQWRQLLKQLEQQRYATDIGFMSSLKY
jgi:hypothetical protein